MSRIAWIGAAALAATAPAQDFPLWGELAPGPHAVGFTSFWDEDASRVYDVEFEDGSRYAESAAPRPILVNLWYPAKAVAGAERLAHRDYLKLPAPSARLAKLGTALSKYALGVIEQWVLDRDPGARDDWDRAEIARILAAPTAAVRDAPAAARPFPLVLYHSGYGSSFEDNSVLCEYLASHGYVVAGSAFLNEAGESFNIDGGAGSARDFACLIRRLAGERYVDGERIAVAGHSGGAHATLEFQAQPAAAVDAVISLDTTQDYVSKHDPHWRHPRAMLANIEHQTAPLLVVAKPHAFFQVCDELLHAERYYLTFRDLDHNDYTLQGVLTAEVAARRARAKSSDDADELATKAAVVRRGFEQCTEYVRLFLDAKLGGDEESQRRLATRYVETEFAGAEPHVVHVPRGTSGPDPYDADSGVPPTPRQLFGLLAGPDVEGVLVILEHYREKTPTAPIFEAQFAYALLYDLVANGREQRAEALAPFYRELQPSLVKLFVWWIERSSSDEYREFRRHALTAAALLDPDNADVQKGLAELRAGK